MCHPTNISCKFLLKFFCFYFLLLILFLSLEPHFHCIMMLTRIYFQYHYKVYLYIVFLLHNLILNNTNVAECAALFHCYTISCTFFTNVKSTYFTFKKDELGLYHLL